MQAPFKLMGQPMGQLARTPHLGRPGDLAHRTRHGGAPHAQLHPLVRRRAPTEHEVHRGKQILVTGGNDDDDDDDHDVFIRSFTHHIIYFTMRLSHAFRSSESEDTKTQRHEDTNARMKWNMDEHHLASGDLVNISRNRRRRASPMRRRLVVLVSFSKVVARRRYGAAAALLSETGHTAAGPADGPPAADDGSGGGGAGADAGAGVGAGAGAGKVAMRRAGEEADAAAAPSMESSSSSAAAEEGVAEWCGAA